MIVLKNFIDLDNNEKEMIIRWRNHPKIRKWMKNSKEIKEKEHTVFMKLLQKSKNRTYFLLKKDNDNLGVVSLRDNYLGIYANPDKKRVGDVLLAKLIEYAFKIKKLPTLKAEVYKDNTKAIKLYTRFGFKKAKDSGDLIVMELKNENSKL